MVHNAKDAEVPAYENILVVGDAGSGKSTLIRSLPGEKFAFIFDPNGLRALQGADVDYEEWLPEALEIDATIKGFNKGAKPDDRPADTREPRVYVDFIESLVSKSKEGFFTHYDWVCFDSITLLQKACHDRQSYINNRYGKPEDIADYRIVGSKVSDLVRSSCSEKVNIYMTGHIDTWQDDKTKVITTQLALSGSAKKQVPLTMSNIWRAECQSTEKQVKYVVQTRPADRGLQTIRSSIRGMEMFEEVTIRDFNKPEESGVARLLNGK